jgi:hypothetical protein
MKQDTWLSQAITVVVASGLGIGIALIDGSAPFGDDSAQFTVFLWLVSSGLLGFVKPRRPWLWAVAVGPWLPMMYLVLQVLGLHAPINPNTYTTSLILIPISLGVCALGAYAGALARRIILPPSRSAGAFSGTGTG